MKLFRLFRQYILIIVISMTNTNELISQGMPHFSELPALPDAQGFAGMFAGVSNGYLFCMGGANFPEKKPWEGGKKKWYDDIYRFTENNQWEKLPQKMPSPLGYGVSVSYKEEIIVIGGNDINGHTATVSSYKWNGAALEMKQYPALPFSLSNMAGAIVGNLMILTGGNQTPSSPASNTCIALDLEKTENGWFDLAPWPGRERVLPVVTVHNGTFYLFSGETVDVNAAGERKRKILQDGYSFTPVKQNGKWTGTWNALATMPRGVSAAGSPLPVMDNGQFVFWGGVDATTALHTDPPTHPGFANDVYLFSPEKNSWSYAGKYTGHRSRVTLPVVYWNQQWVHISGEIAAAVRTNGVIAIQ